MLVPSVTRDAPGLFHAGTGRWARCVHGQHAGDLFREIFLQGESNANTPADRAALGEAQAKALSVPGNGMAVTVDVGDPKDLHPRAKAAVGARLALAAPRVAYGETVVDSGPVFRALQTEGSRVRITFENTGGGLVTNPVPEESVNGFVVVGEDGVFVFAQACIERDGVRVLAKEVPWPVAVRYAWSNAPEVNLTNREGLPARPFRTNTGPLGQR